MNYYIPYFNMTPNVVAPIVSNHTSKGFFAKLLGGLNWSSILNNTQKTLGIVNQTIPMVKQISPIMKNAKTMFKVMNEFKRIDTPKSSYNTKLTYPINDKPLGDKQINTINNEGPTFFIT